jgi:hypothetical protein
MTSVRPSGSTRVNVPLAISTKIIEPSGIAIGPSGNKSPSVIVLNMDIEFPFLAAKCTLSL